MSDATTFELIIVATGLDAFCDELAARVEPSVCDHAPDADKTSAASLLAILLAQASGKQGEECLTLAFTQDLALESFHAENPELRSVHPGRVAVGCFWLGCTHADGRYTVSFTSATRSISSLMKESMSVQGAFLKLARHATDNGVHVINEWNEASLL